MAQTIVTEPTLEPVTLAEVKDHLRITETDTGSEDSVLLFFIETARRYCENFQNRAYLHQTWKLILDGFPRAAFIRIPRPPLVSVAHVKYYATGGTAATLTAANYYVDTDSQPGYVCLGYGESWPSTTLRPDAGVEVQFIAGYGSVASAVPTTIKQAIRELVGHMYERREATDVKQVYEMPWGASSLLWQERVVPI